MNYLCAKWEEELGCNFNIDYLYKCFKMIYYCTIDTRYREFQYKTLHRIVVLNPFLKIVGHKQTEMCYFCNQEKETLSHFMYLCPKVLPIWNSILSSVNRVYNVDVYHGVNYIILGHPNNILFNFISVIVKKFLYYCKTAKKVPSVTGAMKCIYKAESIEKEIANKGNTLHKYYKKWNKIIYT